VPITTSSRSALSVGVPGSAVVGPRGGLSARMEADGDRPGLPWLVFGAGEVPVEHPADRVAG
jgi:hypothetical protein